MPDSFRISTVLPAAPDRLYDAWLDPEEHAAFTGGAATVKAATDGSFTAWDGYISGKILELDPPRRIVQSWRTTEFPPESLDSRVEVIFEETPGGACITVVHTEIPEVQGPQYEQGWREYYFKPMATYFASG